MTKLQLPLKYFTNIDTSVPQLNKYYEKTGRECGDLPVRAYTPT